MGEATRGITVDFVSVVTHEIRTPLTAIQGGASVLRRHWKELPEDTIEQLLDGIDRQAGRLNALVTHLLDLSRLDRGTLVMESSAVAVDAVVAAAVDDLGEQSGGVKADVAPDLWVRGDARRIRQIVSELLSNALDHGGTDVTVEATRSNGAVEVAVADRGPGVPRELEGTVFDRFTRGTVGDHGGWGLGLAVARELAQAQGGRLDYERGSPAGARFTMRLPVAAAEGPE